LEQRPNPVDPLANKNLFELASLGLAYGMYFNVTRDPAAEADLLSDEPSDGDIVIDGGTVQVRAVRDGDGDGDGRIYTVIATATDIAGNVTIRQGNCTVPHDQRPAAHS
jgi:hypothetical protein